jgi:hypothetical protein
MNKGINLATGDIIGILNSDDIFENAYIINNVISQFKKNSEIDIVYGDLVVVSSSNTNMVKRYYSLPNYVTSSLRYGWMPPHPATFIKKSVYIQHGCYKTDYSIAADYEFFVRVLYKNPSHFHYFNSVIVRMRQGGVSSSSLRNIYLLNKEIIRACKENGLYTNWLLLSFKNSI